MEELVPKSGILAISNDGPTLGRTRYFPLQCLFLLLLLVGGNTAAAMGADVTGAPVASVGTSFAIADFDGDHNPDLASVQNGRVGSSTDYWIQLQLTGSGRQAIQLAAPPGGLLIEARDVNGDHAIDLVLTTAWLRHPVAILLNDGHGKFSRIEPTAFPGAFSQPATRWSPTYDQASGAVGVPPQLRSGLSSDATRLLDVRGPADSISAFNSGFFPKSFLLSHAGRAPPPEVL